MAVASVQVSNVFHDTDSGSLPANPTNGNCIVVYCSRYQDGINAGQVTDSKGNTYNQAIHLQRNAAGGTSDGTADERVAIFYALNITGGAGFTFAVELHGNGTTFWAHEFSGVLTSAALDTTGKLSSASAGAPNTGNANSTTNDAVALGAFTHASATAAFAVTGSGWAQSNEEEDNSARQALGGAYKILSASGNDACTWSGSFDNGAVIAILKGAGGGGGGTPQPFLLTLGVG